MGSTQSSLMPAVMAGVLILGLLAGYYYVIAPVMAILGL